CKRIVTAATGEDRRPGFTGIDVVDDRLAATEPEETATLEEILTYHRLDDIRPTIGVVTNNATAHGVPTKSKPYSLFSYKAVFLLTRIEAHPGLFVYQNRVAV